MKPTKSSQLPDREFRSPIQNYFLSVVIWYYIYLEHTKETALWCRPLSLRTPIASHDVAG